MNLTEFSNFIDNQKHWRGGWVLLHSPNIYIQTEAWYIQDTRSDRIQSSQVEIHPHIWREIWKRQVVHNIWLTFTLNYTIEKYYLNICRGSVFLFLSHCANTVLKKLPLTCDTRSSSPRVGVGHETSWIDKAPLNIMAIVWPLMRPKLWWSGLILQPGTHYPAYYLSDTMSADGHFLPRVSIILNVVCSAASPPAARRGCNFTSLSSAT